MRAIAAGVVLTIVAVVAAMIAARAWLVREANAPGVRIAVVSFDNETGSPEYDQAGRGVADAVVARLATPELVSPVAVIGKTAFQQPRGTRDLKAIGTKLRVDYIVIGEVTRDNGRVRLSAHLIRASDEAQMWTKTFERPPVTPEAQSEIADEIARSVTARLRGV